MDFPLEEERSGYTPLDPLWSTEVNLKSAFPLPGGVGIGLYLRHYSVKAFGSPGTFTSNRYGFMLTVPFLVKGGHGTFLY